MFNENSGSKTTAISRLLFFNLACLGLEKGHSECLSTKSKVKWKVTRRTPCTKFMKLQTGKTKPYWQR